MASNEMVRWTGTDEDLRLLVNANQYKHFIYFISINKHFIKQLMLKWAALLLA